MPARALVIHIVNIITARFQINLGALFWFYLLMAIGLIVLVFFGCCVAMDINTYRSLQRRLREERRRKENEEQTVSVIT